MCRKSSTIRPPNSLPTTNAPARFWRKSARSTANYCSVARSFEEPRWAAHLLRASHRRKWELVAFSWPICSKPGSTTKQMFGRLGRELMNPKITEQHRNKPAYVYVRQSTMGQVRHHQENTERQYALRQKALELGWSEAAIRT